MEGFFTVLQAFIVLIVVIALAHISLRLLNRYMVKQNKIIKIWEKISVNNNSSIGVIEVTGKYYLMSFTPNENKILKELEKEEVEEILKKKEDSMDIKENIVYKKVNSIRGKRKHN